MHDRANVIRPVPVVNSLKLRRSSREVGKFVQSL